MLGYTEVLGLAWTLIGWCSSHGHLENIGSLIWKTLAYVLLNSMHWNLLLSQLIFLKQPLTIASCQVHVSRCEFPTILTLLWQLELETAVAFEVTGILLSFAQKHLPKAQSWRAVVDSLSHKWLSRREVASPGAALSHEWSPLRQPWPLGTQNRHFPGFLDLHFQNSGSSDRCRLIVCPFSHRNLPFPG